jgi:hypothetical protein
MSSPSPFLPSLSKPRNKDLKIIGVCLGAESFALISPLYLLFLCFILPF